MKQEWELPLVYRGKPLMVRVTKGGVEFRAKRSQERILVEWLSLARIVLGQNRVFPADSEKGKRHFGAC